MYWKKLIHTHNPVLGDGSLKWSPVIQVVQRWLWVCVLTDCGSEMQGWDEDQTNAAWEDRPTGSYDKNNRLPLWALPTEGRIQTTKFLHIHPHFRGHPPPIQPGGQWESATEKGKIKHQTKCMSSFLTFWVQRQLSTLKNPSLGRRPIPI